MVQLAAELLGLFLCAFALGMIAGRRRTVWLHLSSISFHPKPRIHMTNIKSSVSQFAQITLSPVDVLGLPVKLDEDAIVAEVTAGAGASTNIIVLNDADGGRRFLVNLIPGDAPGDYGFKVRGDAEPGEGVTILEEEFAYTATPNNAVSLGVTVQLLPKSSLPPA